MRKRSSVWLENKRKGVENRVADNWSTMENVLYDPLPIDDSFPDEQLAVINSSTS